MGNSYLVCLLVFVLVFLFSTPMIAALCDEILAGVARCACGGGDRNDLLIWSPDTKFPLYSNKVEICSRLNLIRRLTTSPDQTAFFAPHLCRNPLQAEG